MTARKDSAKRKRKVAPCARCKGFVVPARRVRTVKRDARGRFRRA